MREVRLLEQQRLRVAGEPPGGLVGAAQLGVERQHGDRSRPAQPGADGRDGGAQHVHPRVAAGEHRGARDGVLDHAPDALGGLRDGTDALPAAAGGAELGDRRELVGGRGEAELDPREGLVGGQARVGEQAQRVHPGGERGAELLGVAATRAVVRQGVGDDGAQLGVVAGGLPGVLEEGVGVLLLERRAAPGAGEQRVVAERAADGSGPGLLGEPQQRRRGVRGVSSGLERDRCEIDEHALEQGRQRVDGRTTGVAEHEPERRDAVLQLGHQDVVGVGEIGVGREGVALADQPALGDLSLRPRAAHERRQARHAGVGRRRVLGGVEPRDRDAVVGDRRERRLRLLRRDLAARLRQHPGDQLAPLLARRGVELPGERELLGTLGRLHCGHARIVERSELTVSPPCDRPPTRASGIVRDASLAWMQRTPGSLLLRARTPRSRRPSHVHALALAPEQREHLDRPVAGGAEPVRAAGVDLGGLAGAQD